jgi:hypothetical protein
MDGLAVWGTLGFGVLIFVISFCVLMIYYKLIEMGNTLYEIRELLKRR